MSMFSIASVPRKRRDWRRNLALQRLYGVFAGAVRRVSYGRGILCKVQGKREMKSPQNITMKNGKKAVQGVCPVCGTKLFRIGGKV